MDGLGRSRRAVGDAREPEEEATEFDHPRSSGSLADAPRPWLRDSGRILIRPDLSPHWAPHRVGNRTPGRPSWSLDHSFVTLTLLRIAVIARGRRPQGLLSRPPSRGR